MENAAPGMAPDRHRMHVLHVLHYCPPFAGGIIEHLLELGAAFQRRGDRISFAFPERRAWAASLDPLGEVVVLPEIHKPIRWGFRKRLARLCRDRQVDLVHIHFAFSLPFAVAFAIRPWPVPVVYHWHNPPKALLPRRLQSRKALLPARRRAARLIANLVDRRVITRHVVISSEIEDLLVGYGWTRRDKILRLKNAMTHDVDQKGEPSTSTGVVVFGSVANFRPQKDHATLLRAFRIQARERPDSRLVLVGDGPERGDMERLAGELELGDKVEFTGFVEDAEAQYHRFDVFILSTHYEGHPLVLMEAMNHGLPLVCTDTPATRETFRDGEDGFLVPPEDPKAMAEALMKLASDPDLRQRFGNAGRSRMQSEFGPDHWVHGVLTLYEGLLFPGSPAPPGGSGEGSTEQVVQKGQP